MILITIEEVFGTSDLFKILGIEAEDAADQKKLRKAFLKSALIFHPDKAEDGDKENNTKKFQLIYKINEMLQNAENLKTYIDTKTWPNEEDIDINNLFSGATLSEEMINAFEKEYKGSEEERSDIKKYYTQFEGNIFKVIDSVFFANILTDLDRFEQIIKDCIKNKELTPFPIMKNYEATKKRKIAKAEKEGKMAEEELSKMRIKNKEEESGLASLTAAIAARRQKDNSFLDELEKKYSNNGPQKKRSKK